MQMYHLYTTNVYTEK